MAGVAADTGGLFADCSRESREIDMQCPYCKGELQPGVVKCPNCSMNVESVTRDSAPVAHPATQAQHAGGAAGAGSAAAAGGDFGELFSSALGFWKNNLADLAVLTLVFLLVAWIPVANIGFITGYTRSVLKVLRGQGRAEIGDLFNAWDCFGNLFVYVIVLFVVSMVLNVIPVLGSLASMALGFVAMPGIYAIIDGRIANPVDAFKWGLATIQANLVNWVLAYIVGTSIASAGFLLLLIGGVLTMPLGSLVISLQYERTKG